MRKNEWAGRGINLDHLSLFMGLLLGQELKESLEQIRHQRKRTVTVLEAAEREIAVCRSGIQELRNWKAFKFIKN